MIDIVERLRAAEPCIDSHGEPCRSMTADAGCCCATGAAEIERLRTALTDALPAIHSCMAPDNPTWIAVCKALGIDPAKRY